MHWLQSVVCASCRTYDKYVLVYIGDLSCASNYRPITLSPIISKIFEYCILHKYEHLLQSDDLQLGFKKTLAVHMLYLC